MIIQLPVFIREEENIFIAFCPVFHLSSRGETLKNALDNIKKDLETFLDDEKVQKEHNQVISDYGISDIEIVDVVVHKK